jgi:hypothetical protein
VSLTEDEIKKKTQLLTKFQSKIRDRYNYLSPKKVLGAGHAIAVSKRAANLLKRRKNYIRVT